MIYLIRTDIDDKKKIEIKEGSPCILGRNDVDCDDQRVSRTHCEIQVNNEEVKIKSLHVNPCFILSPGSSDVITINNGHERILQNEDRFGLLPNSHWFKVQVVTADVVDAGVVPTKRQRLNESTEDVKPTLSANESTADVTPNHSANESIADVKPNLSANDSTEDVKPDISTLNGAITQSNIDINETKVKSEANECNVKTESEVSSTVTLDPEDTSDGASQTTSNGPVVRERCMYGDRCYRRNPDHKRMLSHPGDPDYVQAANLPCPFGAQCRRRDVRHWRDMTHPPGAKPGTKKTPTNRAGAQRRARRVAKNRPSWSGSESDNEYDAEDPWLTDGSGSDEWTPGHHESSTDDDF